MYAVSPQGLSTGVSMLCNMPLPFVVNLANRRSVWAAGHSEN